MKNLFVVITLLALAYSTQAQKPKPLSLPITTFTDFSHTPEPAYSYNFGDPVYADIFNENSSTYKPSMSNRYYISIYGPRHKPEPATSNIGYFDFHRGSDITPDVKYTENGVTTIYDENNAPPIRCMCEGDVVEILDGDDATVEATGEGRSVIVKCDDVFAADPTWGNIHIAYRHLESISVAINDEVEIGDEIGIMGESGLTENVHLHLSAIKIEAGTGKKRNVHPMRIFNPDGYDHLLDQLTQAEITQLDYDANSALFRIVVPYNMANFKHIKVTADGGYVRTYDFEEIAKKTVNESDDNDIVNGLELFAYPFNRGRDAYRRFWNRYDDGWLDDTYPASPDRGTGNYYPFLSENLLATPAYVMDILVKDLPAGYNIQNVQISLLDIYGHGVKANGQFANGSFFAYARADEHAKDVEHKNGNYVESDPDLDLEEGRYVGLQFTDLGLPKGACISRAFVHFRADEDSKPGRLDLEVSAERTGQALPFSLSNDLIARYGNETNTSISWSLYNWIDDEMQDSQKLETIQPIVNELVGLPNWSETSPMVLLFEGLSGNGEYPASAYYGDTLSRDQTYIYIEYQDIQNESPSISYYKPDDNSIHDFTQPVYLKAIATDVDNNLSTIEFFVDDEFVGYGTPTWGNQYYYAWTPNSIGTHTVYAVATDDCGQKDITETISFKTLQKQTFQQKITKGSNDVEQSLYGQMNLTDGDLELTRNQIWSWHFAYQTVGLRYENVSIPKDAVITNAYVQFTADEVGTAAGSMYIYAHDVDNAPVFTWSTNNLTNRTLTSDYAYWYPSQWNTVGAAGYAQKTANMKKVIQEIVNRPGWNTGNNLAIIIKGTGKRTAESYEGMPSGAPKLVVEYFDPNDGTAFIGSNNDNEPKFDETFEARESEADLDTMGAETLDFDVKVAPNPVPGQFFTVQIEAPFSEEIAHVTFSDMVGRIISKEILMLNERTEVPLSTDNYPAGTYLVNVIIGNQQQTKRIILIGN